MATIDMFVGRVHDMGWAWVEIPEGTIGEPVLTRTWQLAVDGGIVMAGKFSQKSNLSIDKFMCKFLRIQYQLKKPDESAIIAIVKRGLFKGPLCYDLSKDGPTTTNELFERMEKVTTMEEDDLPLDVELATIIRN
uniref:Uncharacterized protein n=1 Tax=Oryza brachyantha TaxID=4533 RepID=J3N9D4_ORYBR